ncbi:hypothetical protein TOPH_03560 [Tolypocladium ophioglossoides CBS 100239]|uniref:DUF7702 domain-containing protein n=1 Tax=Tolypocladium ophioglossoides (strain CBS 100239) TaxID=1163406 RepID=A0A0L0NDC5_TOLOC|nr:hypothetical protein TOPH_03560 [Tolypocladium ophioglossoides CBS 100239]
MELTSNSIVAIAELGGYIPAIVLAFIVCKRHGFGRSSGWYFTFTLSLIRIVGSVCQLLTITNDSIGLLKAAIILDHIGLTPLLLATLGMLSRLVDWINVQSPSTISIKYFRIVQLLVLLGAVFGIIGAESSAENSISPWTDIAVICYVAAFAALAIILIKALPSTDVIPNPERILAPAVGLALPFVFVRLLYQTLIVFVHRGPFARVGGSVLAHVFMAMVEEFIVVAVYLVLGFKLNRGRTAEKGRAEKGMTLGTESEQQYQYSDGL